MQPWHAILSFLAASMVTAAVTAAATAAAPASPPDITDQFGPIVVLNHEEQSFLNSDCEATGSCNLSGARLVREDYMFWMDDRYHYGTRAFAEYQTRDTASLEAYAWVQQIRGCQFSSSLGSDGTVQRSFDIARHFFGKIQLFRHPSWVIDSDDVDPMYNSPDTDDGGMNRHAYYRWNQVAGSFDEKTESYYGQAKPRLPELYVSDRPGQAWMDPASGIARNISLELRMCLYKTEEIPLSSSPEAISFARPLVCFPWQSSFIYDFTKKDFTSSASIEPACLDGSIVNPF